MMYRVLHVIARINVGGTASFLYSLTQFESREWEQLIATGCVQSPELEDVRISQMPVVRISKLGRRINLKSDIAARKEIKRLIEEYSPDLIISHTFKAGLLVRSIRNKVPVIHIYHGHLLNDPEFTEFEKRVIILIERVLASRATMLVTTGRKVSQELQSVGIHHNVWRNIHPGISPLLEINRETALRNLGIEDLHTNDLVIAWHSRFAPVKNVQLVMEIASAMPDCIFLVSGGGPLFERYQLAHPKNVQLLGWQSPEDVLGASDILISTSFNEGLPLTLVEASMLGKPCITSNVGSVEDIVVDGKTGFVIENTRDAFIEKIKTFQQNRNLIEEFGKRARAHTFQKFSQTLFYKNYEEILREALTI